MPHVTELDKLEQRYRENRKGRTFAPLADAYRKAGLIDNAVILCEEGLKLHPDYVSAWIVYGRCLVDKKDDKAAEDVYQKVLALDPENVLALRTLAELSERGGRLDAALSWLNRLLAADPMNGDASDALMRVKGKVAVAAKAPTAAPAQAPTPTVPRAAAPRPQASPPPVADLPPLEIERASLEETPVAPAAGPSGDLETFDGALDFDAVAHEAAKTEGLEVEEEVTLKPERVEIEGLARTQYEGSGMFQLDHLPAEAAAQSEIEELTVPVDLPLIMPDDTEPPRRSGARPTPPPAPAPAPAPVPPPPPPAPAASVPAPPRAAGTTRARLADDDGAADRTVLSQAEPVLTETMAELYLRQGHKEDALRVYRALLEQRPGDTRLRDKIDTLLGRKRTSGQSAGAFLRNALRPGGASGPAAPSLGGDAQVSALVAGAFADMTGEPIPGAPTKPADDTISLDSVFGESEPGIPPGPADGGPPPEGGHAAAPPDAGPATGSGFSFDEFFSAAGGAPGQAPRTSGRQARPPAEDEGDADQFQAWLKKLKS